MTDVTVSFDEVSVDAVGNDIQIEQYKVFEVDILGDENEAGLGTPTGTGSVSIVINDVSAGEHTYVARAVAVGGVVGAASDEVVVQVSGVPAAPTGIVATVEN